VTGPSSAYQAEYYKPKPAFHISKRERKMESTTNAKQEKKSYTKRSLFPNSTLQEIFPLSTTPLANIKIAEENKTGDPRTTLQNRLHAGDKCQGVTSKAAEKLRCRALPTIAVTFLTSRKLYPRCNLIMMDRS
jgi:hypothetical protein